MAWDFCPTWQGIRGLARVGSWLMLRTLSLRVAILATVLVVTAQGAVNLAAHQLAMTIFSFLAFALDALAIAAQALIGKELGAGNPREARLLTRTMTRWGIGFGVLTGLLLAIAAPWVGALFTPDPEVGAVLATALWILAAGQPVAGYVFVLDGVLIGAGDARYLALAGLANLAVYAPLLAWVAAHRPARRRGPRLALGRLCPGLHGCPGRDAGRARPVRPVDGPRFGLAPPRH